VRVDGIAPLAEEALLRAMLVGNLALSRFLAAIISDMSAASFFRGTGTFSRGAPEAAFFFFPIVVRPCRRESDSRSSRTVYMGCYGMQSSDGDYKVYKTTDKMPCPLFVR
jgi:hypothetical protein